MMRSLLLSFVALALVATLAFADAPGVTVDYVQEIPRVRLNGSYAGQLYSVHRADAGTSSGFMLLSEALCTGDCYVIDREAIRGATYEYTFRFPRPDGSVLTFGPYPVTIGHPVQPGARLAISPNPTRQSARIRVDAARDAGAPADRVLGTRGEVTLLDVRGRVVRRLWAGDVQALTFDVDFDGRDSGGARVAPGLYFAHFRAGGMAATTRLVVTR